MKLNLIVLTAGKWEGKTIPITLSQFLIGRDPQCHLRPASPVISKRHCAILVRKEKVFARDFDSTNGTLLNDEAIKGEAELKDGDHLTVGPISFRVQLEASAAAEKPGSKTSIPAASAAPPATAANDDDSVADMLMSILDDGGPTPLGPRDAVPDGSTVMDMVAPPGADPKKDKPAAKAPAASTSNAAKAILDKYMRRPRAE